MAWHASAIVAAELRVVQSRRDLRDGLRRLRCRLTRPSFLAAAAAVGALLGYSLTRCGRTGVVAGALATALIRYGVQHLLLSRASTPTAAPPTPSV
jgi:hypothetical protein